MLCCLFKRFKKKWSTGGLKVYEKNENEESEPNLLIIEYRTINYHIYVSNNKVEQLDVRFMQSFRGRFFQCSSENESVSGFWSISLDLEMEP